MQEQEKQPMTETGVRKDCCADWPKPCGYHEGWIDGNDVSFRSISDDELSTAAILLIRHDWTATDYEYDPAEQIVGELIKYCEPKGFLPPMIALVEDPAADFKEAIEDESTAVFVIDHLIERFDLKQYRT